MSNSNSNKDQPPAVNSRSERHLVTPKEISGRLRLANDTAEILLIWNVSERGLCVWTSAPLSCGEVVVFEMTKPWHLAMHSEVRWCREVPDRSGYLLGLLALDHHEELGHLVQALGQKVG